MPIGFFVKKDGTELDCTGGFGDFYVQHALIECLAGAGIVVSEYDGGEIDFAKLREVKDAMERLRRHASLQSEDWPLIERRVGEYYERHRCDEPCLCPRELLLSDIDKLLLAIDFALRHHAKVEFLGD